MFFCHYVTEAFQQTRFNKKSCCLQHLFNIVLLRILSKFDLSLVGKINSEVELPIVLKNEKRNCMLAK